MGGNECSIILFIIKASAVLIMLTEPSQSSPPETDNRGLPRVTVIAHHKPALHHLISLDK